jgi:hypothetical protein
MSFALGKPRGSYEEALRSFLRDLQMLLLQSSTSLQPLLLQLSERLIETTLLLAFNSLLDS